MNQYNNPAIDVKCQTCKKVFKAYPCRIKKGHAKFCSKVCFIKFQKGKPAWNKGKPAPWITGKNAPWWKGDKVKYIALHQWIAYHKEKPQKCFHCGITSDKKKLNWANIDHKYSRNLDDYIPLCYSCHRLYDYNNFKFIILS